jgi:hypothetical protein
MPLFVMIMDRVGVQQPLRFISSGSIALSRLIASLANSASPKRHQQELKTGRLFSVEERWTLDLASLKGAPCGVIGVLVRLHVCGRSQPMLPVTAFSCSHQIVSMKRI